MITKIVKWSALAALIAIAFTRSVPDFELMLRFVIAAAAGVVLIQAANMRRFVWVALFLAVACLFNPVVYVPMPEYVSRIVSASTILLFFFSLVMLQPRPALLIASITDPIGRREAL